MTSICQDDERCELRLAFYEGKPRTRAENFEGRCCGIRIDPGSSYDRDRHAGRETAPRVRVNNVRVPITTDIEMLFMIT